MYASILFKACFGIFIFLALDVHARQIQGRTTLPSDCTASETWVRDHSKNTGNWTAYCRAKTGKTQSRNYNFWAPKFKPGRPVLWPFREKSTDWNSKDIQDVFWAFENIPNNLWSEFIKGIYRMHRSKDHPNPAILHQNNIVLYDPAFQNEEYLAQILSHELAHSKFEKFSTLQKMDYAKAASWKILKNPDGSTAYFPPTKNLFVQSDGQDSIDEDFSNNIEYFLFYPDTLKEVNPGAYLWIKNHFGENFHFGRQK